MPQGRDAPGPRWLAGYFGTTRWLPLVAGGGITGMEPPAGGWITGMSDVLLGGTMTPLFGRAKSPGRAGFSGIAETGGEGGTTFGMGVTLWPNAAPASESSTAVSQTTGTQAGIEGGAEMAMALARRRMGISCSIRT